jgi:hypothetical protein
MRIARTVKQRFNCHQLSSSAISAQSTSVRAPWNHPRLAGAWEATTFVIDVTNFTREELSWLAPHDTILMVAMTGQRQPSSGATNLRMLSMA